MRVVLQRVTQAEVTVEGKTVGAIGQGLMLLLGVGPEDTELEARFLAEKCVNLRIFEDAQGLMNRSLLEVAGGLLVVSNFTLYGDCRKGRRPSFVKAAKPEQAQRLYEQFLSDCRAAGASKVEHGIFGAQMQVRIVNDGPVTLVLDTDTIMPGCRGEG